MGGRLSLQRTTRPLVPDNSEIEKRALPLPSSQEPQMPGALQPRAPAQPHPKISLSAKALAFEGWKPGDFAQIAARPMNLTTS